MELEDNIIAINIKSYKNFCEVNLKIKYWYPSCAEGQTEKFNSSQIFFRDNYIWVPNLKTSALAIIP